MLARLLPPIFAQFHVGSHKSNISFQLRNNPIPLITYTFMRKVCPGGFSKCQLKAKLTLVPIQSSWYDCYLSHILSQTKTGSGLGTEPWGTPLGISRCQHFCNVTCIMQTASRDCTQVTPHHETRTPPPHVVIAIKTRLRQITDGWLPWIDYDLDIICLKVMTKTSLALHPENKHNIWFKYMADLCDAWLMC